MVCPLCSPVPWFNSKNKESENENSSNHYFAQLNGRGFGLKVGIRTDPDLEVSYKTSFRISRSVKPLIRNETAQWKVISPIEREGSCRGTHDRGFRSSSDGVPRAPHVPEAKPNSMKPTLVLTDQLFPNTLSSQSQRESVALRSSHFLSLSLLSLLLRCDIAPRDGVGLI